MQHSVIDVPPTILRYKAVFAFCGVGGGAIGFKKAKALLARLGLAASFEILGGIECDESTAADFRRLTGAPCLVARIEELTAERLREFFGDDVDLIFFSPPCKAASGLLSPELAASAKYQSMGMLGSVWIDLMFAAWPRGPRLLLMENVPRIRLRFPRMMEHIRETCLRHKFHLHESAHDLGELGGLAQHRERLLFVGRRHDVPTLLYRPRLQRVRSIGEVLSMLPMPGDPSAGRLHQLPTIGVMTALRLALIPAGGDWRNLPTRVHLHPAFAKLLGKKRPAPSTRVPFNDVWRVMKWTDKAGCVTSGQTPSAGGMSVADPCGGRRNTHARNDDHGVLRWGERSGTMTGKSRPSHGRFSVADPSTRKPSHPRTWGVQSWTQSSNVITGNAHPGGGPGSVADPRVTLHRFDDAQYGVVPDDGREGLPTNVPFPVILSPDGTWHRPMTLLERAVLQGFEPVTDGVPFDLDGGTDACAVKIGDAVPPLAAETIAEQMLYTLLHADAAAGEFVLAKGGRVWVRDRRDRGSVRDRAEPMVALQ